MRHTHRKRDIKENIGECPRCDEYFKRTNMGVINDEKLDYAAKDFVIKFARQLPGSFDFTEGTKCFKAGVAWRDANPPEGKTLVSTELLGDMIAALEFYAGANNYWDMGATFFDADKGQQAQTALDRWNKEKK